MVDCDRFLFANDGVCDEPTWCDVGTDTTDCSSPTGGSTTGGSTSGGSTTGGSTTGGSTGPDSCEYSNDGWCDDGSHPNFDGLDICDPGTDETDCQ